MIAVGDAGVAVTIVSENNTAKTVGSGSLDVFSTPMMIALMESAACNCIADGLADGQTSVGTQISINHVSASPLGAEISATATITWVEGRKILFDVVAAEGTKEIGRGTHERFVVDAERFMNKLKG